MDYQILEAADTVFVFPTEVAARFWRDWTARHGAAGAVRSDRFISWDTFLEQILPAAAHLKKADQHVRHAASRQILSRMGESDGVRLSWLIPESCRQEHTQFSRMITALLPRLEELNHSTALPPELHADITSLYEQYSAMLSTGGFYEPAFEQYRPDCASLDSRRRVICFPEMITRYDQLLGKLEDVSCINSAEWFEHRRTGKLRVFSNSAQELAAVTGWIDRLLDSGVLPSQIHLTVGEFDFWRAKLEEQFALRGIPAVFRQGERLAAHPGGRLFFDLETACTSKWSLEAVKRLFLNRAYPWKQGGQLMRIAETGIRERCIREDIPGSASLWKQALERSGDPELIRIWRRFTGHVRQLTEEQDPEGLWRSLTGFLDTWLDRESRRSDEFTLVFDFCIQQARDLTRACSSLGLESCGSLYRLWLQVMQDQRYVPQHADEGVQVYPYGLSAGICPEYHGVVSLTQEAVRSRGSSMPFFSDAAADLLGLEVRDITEDILNLYDRSAFGQLYLSGSQETFSGHALIPSRFTSPEAHEAEAVPEGCDPYAGERRWWALEGNFPRECYPLQRQGFSFAETALFSPDPAELFDRSLGNENREYREIVSGWSRRKDPGYIRVSPYSLDAFIQCPFLWVIRFLLDLEDFDPSPPLNDPRMEGTLLHQCLQDFFREAVAVGGRFESSRISSYRKQLGRILERNLAAYARRNVWMIPAVRQHLHRQFSLMFDDFLEFESRHFNQWSCTETELSVTCRDDQAGWSASGKIDRISRTPDGRGIGIIDYKRSRPRSTGSYAGGDSPPPSYQLPFYAWMIRMSQRYPEPVVCALFYSLRDGSGSAAYSVLKDFSKGGAVTDPQVFSDLLDETGRQVADMSEAVRRGDFTGGDSADPCRNCGERMLCRRRYYVR